jgi:hypothetical protein
VLKTSLVIQLLTACGVPLAGANFLMNLCASNSMTLTNVAFVKNTVKELVCEVVSHLQDRTQAVLAKAGCESSSAKELMLDFETWKNPFWGTDSHSQLKKYMERNHFLTEPVMIHNGVRWETKHKGDKNSCDQVQVSDTFCYIPIEDTLRLVLQHAQSLDLMMSWCSTQCTSNDDDDDKVYSDWCDGKNGAMLKEYFNMNYGQLYLSFPN